ncbi:hypothetical protein BJY16_007597 [Actinoplanes octamycinicus]|uniref:Uncharacterized protein n=1 Tax=Actinoplanes octamycinicus TaxID=135948 RepID=A0A7W7MBI1_9ACTN|nr:hypothetical protein [Actinoplanes octamycinicus]MBB4744138.1 hypothetical protein [Actinoplanes octamycinicus]
MWSVGHLHDRVDAPGRPPVYLDCRDILKIRRHRARGLLEVVFREKADGPLSSGAVLSGAGRALNLHEPGTARAFLDEALRGGWQPDHPAPVEVDGWVLFDAVLGRRRMP